MNTALQLVNEVLRRSGQMEIPTLTDARTPAVQTLSFLNETCWEMLQRLKVQRLLKTAVFTTVTGTLAYNTANDTEINAVVSDSVVDLNTQQALAEVDYSYPIRQGLTAVGRPVSFYRFGNQLCLYPIPDNVYQFSYHYWVKPTDLQQDNDVTLLPVEWEKVLILGTQSRLEKFLGESGTESYLLFRESLDRLRNRAAMKPTYRMKGFYCGYEGLP